MNTIKRLFRSHRNIKTRLVLICLTEQKRIDKRKTISVQDRAYFHSETHINLEATDVKEILSRMICGILNKISIYQKKKMVRVGILKRFSILKFIPLILNQ